MARVYTCEDLAAAREAGREAAVSAAGDKMRRLALALHGREADGVDGLAVIRRNLQHAARSEGRWVAPKGAAKAKGSQSKRTGGPLLRALAAQHGAATAAEALRVAHGPDGDPEGSRPFRRRLRRFLARMGR